MTTRTLVLIRHSKAAAHGTTDIDRALAPRGLRDATAIGQWLVAQGIGPDHAAVSSALRTRQTWDQIAAELATPPPPSFEARIYDNSIEDLLAVVAETPASAGVLAVVGHNPSMHGLAANLDDGTGAPEARHEVGRDFPTSAVAVFTLEGGWAEVDLGRARLIASGVPRG